MIYVLSMSRSFDLISFAVPFGFAIGVFSNIVPQWGFRSQLSECDRTSSATNRDGGDTSHHCISENIEYHKSRYLRVGLCPDLERMAVSKTWDEFYAWNDVVRPALTDLKALVVRRISAEFKMSPAKTNALSVLTNLEERELNDAISLRFGESEQLQSWAHSRGREALDFWAKLYALSDEVR